MKTCDDVRVSLSAWLDGELSRPDVDQVQSHIEVCSACRRERRELELVDVWLKRTFQPAAAQVAFEPFWDAVRQRITAQTPWHHRMRDWVGATFTPARLAWGVPAILALILLGLSIDTWWPGGRSSVQRNNFAAVDSIDAYGRNVALLREDETKTTVIWLYQNQEGDDETAAESSENKPSF
ncbi:MAG TPA: anti-sigma factor [Terriglobales bacterium]|nr:anti-sigma factor [Terriglobales bacterium]